MKMKRYNESITILAQGEVWQVPLLIEDLECEVGAQVTITMTCCGETYVGRGQALDWADAFADLQKNLPEGVTLQCCMTCRYGTQTPFGCLPNYLLCTQGETIKSKHDVVDWLLQRQSDLQQFERTAVQGCAKFAPVSDDYFTYNDYGCCLRK